MLIVVGNPADDDGVICVLHNGVLSMSGVEQEGTEHTALWAPVLGTSGRDVTANPDCLGSFCEEAQCPVAECGALAQSVEFSN